jgi:hypothetical protein
MFLNVNLIIIIIISIYIRFGCENRKLERDYHQYKNLLVSINSNRFFKGFDLTFDNIEARILQKVNLQFQINCIFRLKSQLMQTLVSYLCNLKYLHY